MTKDRGRKSAPDGEPDSSLGNPSAESPAPDQSQPPPSAEPNRIANTAQATTFTIRPVARHDLDSAIAIVNREISSGVNIFRLVPLDEKAAQRWWDVHASGRYQALVAACRQTDAVFGWAAYTPHSHYEGYDRTADLSVWVDSSHRGKGVGKALVRALLASCPARNLRTIVSRIESNNLASIRLHESLGFVHAGVLRDVGEKLGQSLHVVFMQFHVPA